MEAQEQTLQLQPMTRQMCHEFYRTFRNDPAVFRNAEDFSEYVYRPETVDHYFDTNQDASRRLFAIVVDGELVGECKLKYIDPAAGACSLGIHLRDDTVKGKGYGTRAEGLLVQYAFEELGLRTVNADALLENTRSQHVLEKVGFQFLREDDVFRYYRLERPCPAAKESEMQLEAMDTFFDSRLDGYEAHMMDGIDSAREFYPFTARRLPQTPGARILDLGCGTGLELDAYFALNPTARVTGIDLAPGMLGALKRKHPQRHLELICGSYFEVPFGQGRFDGAVSVESLHHFTQTEKAPLYRKLRDALKDGGWFILTDYFSLSEAQEQAARQQLEQLKARQGLDSGTLCHFDTPLTVEHEIQALRAAGFSQVEVLKNWGATYTLRAEA